LTIFVYAERRTLNPEKEVWRRYVKPFQHRVEVKKGATIFGASQEFELDIEAQDVRSGF
jgi:hypothetical protein